MVIDNRWPLFILGLVSELPPASHLGSSEDGGLDETETADVTEEENGEENNIGPSRMGISSDFLDSNANIYPWRDRNNPIWNP